MNNVNYHMSLPTISELLSSVPDTLPDPKALQATVMARAVRDPNAPKLMLTEEQERQLKEQLNKAAVKFDQHKLDWMILPYDALEEIVKVLQFGAAKYARGNYANGSGLEYTRVLNSLMRHILAFARGEDIDPETGLSHMAHAGCNVLFLLHYIKNPEKFSTNDDRGSKIVQ